MDDYILINAKSNYRPAVFDNKGNQVVDAEEIQELIYGGCYARAKIIFHPYTFAGKEGITVVLQGIQFVKEGKAFGGGNSVSFDAIEEGEDW